MFPEPRQELKQDTSINKNKTQISHQQVGHIFTKRPKLWILQKSLSLSLVPPWIFFSEFIFSIDTHVVISYNTINRVWAHSGQRNACPRIFIYTNSITVGKYFIVNPNEDIILFLIIWKSPSRRQGSNQGRSHLMWWGGTCTAAPIDILKIKIL